MLLNFKCMMYDLFQMQLCLTGAFSIYLVLSYCIVLEWKNGSLLNATKLASEFNVAAVHTRPAPNKFENYNSIILQAYSSSNYRMFTSTSLLFLGVLCGNKLLVGNIALLTR